MSGLEKPEGVSDAEWAEAIKIYNARSKDEQRADYLRKESDGKPFGGLTLRQFFWAWAFLFLGGSVLKFVIFLAAAMSK